MAIGGPGVGCTSLSRQSFMSQSASSLSTKSLVPIESKTCA